MAYRLFSVPFPNKNLHKDQGLLDSQMIYRLLVNRTQRRYIYIYLFSTLLSLAENSGLWRSSRESSALPIPVSVCSICVCSNNGIWLPEFGIFNVCTDVDTCDYTRHLHGHGKRVCTATYSVSWLWGKHILRRTEDSIELVSVLRLEFALPTELSPVRVEQQQQQQGQELQINNNNNEYNGLIL